MTSPAVSLRRTALAAHVRGMAEETLKALVTPEDLIRECWPEAGEVVQVADAYGWHVAWQHPGGFRCWSLPVFAAKPTVGERRFFLTQMSMLGPYPTLADLLAALDHGVNVNGPSSAAGKACQYVAVLDLAEEVLAADDVACPGAATDRGGDTACAGADAEQPALVRSEPGLLVAAAHLTRGHAVLCRRGNVMAGCRGAVSPSASGAELLDQGDPRTKSRPPTVQTGPGCRRDGGVNSKVPRPLACLRRC